MAAAIRPRYGRRKGYSAGHMARSGGGVRTAFATAGEPVGASDRDVVEEGDRADIGPV